MKLKVKVLLLIACVVLTCVFVACDTITSTDSITVRFIVDDIVYEEITGKLGDPIVAPETDPIKDGMNFVRWEGFVEGSVFSQNKDYVAVFEPVSEPPIEENITVRFLVDGEEYAKVVGKKGEVIVVPETDPTKDGMSFVRWEGFTEGATFSENKDFVAVFESENEPPVAEDVTVRFLVDGEEYAKVVGKEGEVIEAPETDPTKDGMKFVRWEGFTEGATFNIDRDYEAVFEKVIVEIDSAPIAKVETADYNNDNLNKDAMFNSAADINKFNRVQNEGNRSYIVNLVHDNSYLYVYIQSTVEAGNDADRLSFYIVKKDSDKTTLIETYPNKGEISKGGDACVSIKVGKIDGGYALKAKIDLSTLAISANNEIGFGVRFVNSDNTVFLSVGSTADDGSHTKVENANNLSKLSLTDYVAPAPQQITVRFLVDGAVYKTVEGNVGDPIAVPENPTKDGMRFVRWEGLTEGALYSQDIDYNAVFEAVIPEISSAPIAKVETADYNNDNLNKDAMFNSAADINKFNRVQNEGNRSYIVNLVHDNSYLYVYIQSTVEAGNDADRLSFYIVKKDSDKTTLIETYPNKGEISKGGDACVSIKVGKIDGGYALKAKIDLSTLAISANNEIGFGVRFVNSDNTVFISVGSTADDGSHTKVENANNLSKLTLTDYVAPTPVAPTIGVDSIAYVSNASYDNSNLNKDAMFDSAANITSFNRVQGDTDHSYTINLVHDNTNLYVYIFSADSNRNDNDRISFYIGKNGASETTLVETKPNKDDPYTAGKDACDEINVGKVEGGYVLKAKIALSSLEISADGKVGFCVRLINNDNADIHLSIGAKPNDGNGSTKVKLVSNLAQLTLVDYTKAND